MDMDLLEEQMADTLNVADMDLDEMLSDHVVMDFQQMLVDGVAVHIQQTWGDIEQNKTQ